MVQGIKGKQVIARGTGIVMHRKVGPRRLIYFTSNSGLSRFCQALEGQDIPFTRLSGGNPIAIKGIKPEEMAVALEEASPIGSNAYLLDRKVKLEFLISGRSWQMGFGLLS